MHEGPWKKRRAALYVTLAALLWALDGFIRYPASHAFRVHQLVFLEHLVGLVVVLPIFLARSPRSELRKLRWSHAIAVAGIAIVGSILGNALYTRSIQAVGVATGTLFQVIQPLTVLGLAAVFLHERRSGRYFPVAIWVLLNAFLIVFPDVSLGFSGDEAVWANGLLFGFGAMLAWGISTVAGKWLLRDFQPLTVLFFRWSMAMTFTGAYTYFSSAPFPVSEVFEPVFFGRLVALALIPGVLGFFFYYRGLARLPASLVTFIELIYPIIGIFLPIITMHAGVSAIQVFGASTILLSVLLLVVFEINAERVPSSRP